MCLTIPLRIEAIDGLMARGQAKGVWREMSLFFLQDDLPKVGEYVLVHLGQAMQKVSEEDARLAWELYDQILAESGGACPPE